MSRSMTILCNGLLLFAVMGWCCRGIYTYLVPKNDPSQLPKISISKSKGKLVGYMEHRLFRAKHEMYVHGEAWRPCIETDKDLYTIREFQGTLTLHKAKCPPLVENIELEEMP